jgi:hypothetical protein
MVSGFLLKFGNLIQKDDVILVGSANQLLREGLEGYVGSLLDTMDRLSVGIRSGCKILPAPIILLDGCGEEQLIKNIIDLHAWIRLSGVDSEGVLNDTMGVIEHNIRSSKRDTITWSPVNMKLPLTLPSRKKTSVHVPATNLPKGVDPVPVHIETLIIHTLNSSLNEQLGTDLDCNPSLTREEANSTNECFKFVLIGGPHAEAAARVLNELGHDCKLLNMPHYRASAVYSGKILDGLAELTIDEETIVVAQVFDSGIFWVRTEEGGLIPPCKRADGSYHIDGELEVVSRDMQYDCFKHLVSELSQHKRNKLILMAPLPRYLEEGCCGDADHVSNRQRPDYKKKQEEAIFAARQNLKNFAFRQGLRECVTVSTWGKVRHLDVIWNGPTALTETGYLKVAEAILVAASEVKKKRRTDSTTVTPNEAGWTSIPETSVLACPLGRLEANREAVADLPEEQEAGEEASEEELGEVDSRCS